MLPTGREYFLSFYGILLAGAIPVPVYPPVRPSQLEDHLRRQTAILSNCRASIMITVPEAKALARLLKAQVESLRQVVTLDTLVERSGTYETPVIKGGDIAFLQYTSGSTGNPKGVILTHANLLANIRADGEAIAADATDVFVSWLPLYHDMGLIGAWLGCLYHTPLLVVMSPLEFLTRPQRWLWAMHRYRGSLSAAPNFAYELCLRRLQDNDLEGLNLGAWRLSFNGAEAISPETMQRFSQRFERYGFRREAMFPVYGLAECSVGLTFPPLGRGPLVDHVQRERFVTSGLAVPAAPDDGNALRFVACGSPLPGHQIRVVDPNGRELPERQEGRLQFVGPSATSGYYLNPEATRKLFQEQWLNTGDLAYIAAGELYVTGRTKDVIIRAGRNIYPEELEQAVGEIPGIRRGRVAAFGSADPQSGTERLVVLAETHERAPSALEELRAEVNALATDVIGAPPDDVVLAPPNTVLKTSSGKIRRTASRELYEQARIGEPQKAVWLQLLRIALGGVAPRLRRLRRSATAVLYAAYTWTLLCVIAPVAWLGVVLLPRPSWRWSTIRGLARLLVRISGTAIDVEGQDNLLREGPCVVVANHASYLDALFLVAVVPREFSFVAKSELLKQPLARIFLRRIGTEYVERFDKQRGVADARRIASVAVSGRSLLFFAEGTLQRMPGVLPFHLGAFAAAVEAAVPLVPIAIRGTRSMLRADSWFPRRGAVTIKMGPAIEPLEQATGTLAEPWAQAISLRDAARDYILRNVGEPDLGYENPFASGS
jgi:1-acyl-sn-glycerol-3-phosphate acyltransferase